MKKKVAIIGSGLAGLNCARLLENSFNVSIFEKNAQIGGRIVTDHQDGYILDHGFQVFLPDYPEAREAFDYKTLKLLEFTPGAFLRVNKIFHRFSDPIRRPQDILATMMAPVGNLKDKLLILKLKKAVCNIDQNLKKTTTYDYLVEFGFSKEMINGFFKPFFSGIFLERELKTSAFFFSSLFYLFSKCNATIPEKGMSELPNNLFNQLTKTTLYLNTEVNEIKPQQLTANNEILHFDYVICAYDIYSKSFNSVTTDYFTTNDPITVSPTLYLNTHSRGIINHIAPMSIVNGKYSPKGKFLWAVNLISPHGNTPIPIVEKELIDWFPQYHFQHLKRYTVKKALPSSPLYGESLLCKDGVYYCGDQMEDPSINGALKSGRILAEHLLSLN